MNSLESPNINSQFLSKVVELSYRRVEISEQRERAIKMSN